MPPFFLVILTAVPFICGAFAIFLAFVIFGRRTIRHFGHNLDWSDCPKCTAGTQWYDAKLGKDGTPLGWGPIPVRIRMVNDFNPHFNPPQANVRQCTNCRGLGGFWVDRKAEDSVEVNGPDHP